MFKIDIEKETIKNRNYRKVLKTTSQMQLVLMNIPVGEDIPKEKHHKTTQFIRFEKGVGEVQIGRSGKKRCRVKDGDIVIIPAGTYHKVINKGRRPLKLYALYSPPEHKPGLVQKNKPDSIE